jgi:hypothetical protein
MINHKTDPRINGHRSGVNPPTKYCRTIMTPAPMMLPHNVPEPR